jgi:hypothetical protein
MIYVIAYHQSMSGMASINISPMFVCFQLCWCRWHPESWVGLENQDGQRQLCHTGLRRQHRLTSVQRPSPVCQYDGVDYPDRCCCSWSPTAHAWPIVRRRCRRGPRSDQWTRHLSIRSTARLYSGFNRFFVYFKAIHRPWRRREEERWEDPATWEKQRRVQAQRLGTDSDGVSMIR